MSWIKHYDVQIFEKSRSLIFNFDNCFKNCLHEHKSITIFNKRTRFKNRQIFQTFDSNDDVDIAKITTFAFMKMIENDKNQVIAMWSKHFDMFNRSKKLNKHLVENILTTNVVVIIVENYEKFIIKIKKNSIIMKQLLRKVFKRFHKYIKIWNLIEINKISSRKKWNYRIDLILDVKSSTKKIYELSREQTFVMKKYIDKMLTKDFIKLNHSSYVVSILIIKKSKKDFKKCIDYKALNVLTIKNKNVSSFIRETLTRLCSTKYFNKFDIIVVFNEIRMRKSDEKKTIFLTRYELFEYVVMFFDLCNVLEIFQIFINETFREYLNDFCTSHLNDIFIYNNIYEEHKIHVSKMLKRLIETKLFLNIDKCEFFVKEVKYSSLIIIIEEIKMNSRKIETIVNWKKSRCIKNVQTFLNFCNFHRKFIHNYSNIIVFLNKLTRNTKKIFVFFWVSKSNKDKALRALKKIFVSIDMLTHFDSNLKIWIKIDVFDYVVAIILFQRNKDEIVRLVAFMFKKMSFAKCNYEIYDKELLIIVRVFEKWRLECVKTSIENSIKISIDHRNLKHFMIFKQLNRRQVRWTKLLFEFNFQIIYRSSVQNIKLDNLTRRFQNLSTNNNDARKQYLQQTLLKIKHLNKNVRVVIVVVSKLMNEIEKNSMNLISMIYDLSEEELDKTMTTTFANIIESSIDVAFENTTIVDFTIEIVNNEFVNDASTINAFENDTSQTKLMNRIKQIYFNNITLQRIMKAKRENFKRISFDIIKNEIKFEFENCEIKKNLFWVKNKLYVSTNKSFHATLIKHIHESSFENYAKKVVTYDKVNTHYYWFKMTNIITQYVKTCHSCKRIKTYREKKHDLLKSLSISKKY